jgi:Domain of unknown function (DUF1990)
MKIYLRNQTAYFKKHLQNLKQQNAIKYDKQQLTEKITSIEISTNKAFGQLDTNFFWDYNIFPNNILCHLTEWTDQKRTMQIGDTIVQQAFIPPLKNFSQKIIFGVRINNIIKESNRIGFSYETLEGHVEMGESTFSIEQQNDGKIVFKIHTFSKPGNFLTKLLAPIFSIPYQTYCTRQGLENVRKQLETF